MTGSVRAWTSCCAERALHHDMLTAADVEQVRLRLEEARARRLQPHYISAFFRAAFTGLGGRISRREPGRYAVSGVPAALREARHPGGAGAAPLRAGHLRPGSDPPRRRLMGSPPADLLAPGHPLLDAVVDATIGRCAAAVQRGAILVDRLDPAEDPRVLAAFRMEISDGNTPPQPVLRRFEFAELLRRRPASLPPVPRRTWTTSRSPTMSGPWSRRCSASRGWGRPGSRRCHGPPPACSPPAWPRWPNGSQAAVERTRRLVRQRLLQEINYWDARHGELLAQAAPGTQRQGDQDAARRPPSGAARDLEHRLEVRLAELDREAHLVPRPPVITAAALIVPQGLLDRLAGRRDQPARALHAGHREESARRAVAAIVEAERSLGRDPEVMPHNNKGYDIRSRTPDGHLVYLEVKGRDPGAETFSVTRNEVAARQERRPPPPGAGLGVAGRAGRRPGAVRADPLRGHRADRLRRAPRSRWSGTISGHGEGSRNE